MKHLELHQCKPLVDRFLSIKGETPFTIYDIFDFHYQRDYRYFYGNDVNVMKQYLNDEVRDKRLMSKWVSLSKVDGSISIQQFNTIH